MTASSRPREVHGLAARENLDKILLALAGLIGVGGGLLLKIAHTPPLAPAAFSAAVLIAYVLLTWAGGRLRIEPETIGDNCYYLGFIFTLFSLAYTLYSLAEAPENVDLVADIVSGFGVALSSTILGVMLRVFLLQFRPDMVATDRETRLSLQNASREYRAALGQSSTVLKQFTIELQQKLSEHHEKLRADSEAALADQRRRIEEETRRSGEALQQATAEAVRKALAAVEEMTRASIARAEQGARNSAERSEAVARAASERAATETKAAMDRSEAVAVAAAQRAERMARETSERTGDFLDEFAQKVSEALSALHLQMEGLAASGGETGEKLRGGVEALQSSTARFQQAMERLSTELEAATPGIEAAARRAAGAMESASDAYAERLEAIAGKIDPGRLDAALSTHEASLQETLAAIRAAGVSFTTAAQTGSGAADELRRSTEALARNDARLSEAIGLMRAAAPVKRSHAEEERRAGQDAAAPAGDGSWAGSRPRQSNEAAASPAAEAPVSSAAAPAPAARGLGRLFGRSS